MELHGCTTLPQRGTAWMHNITSRWNCMDGSSRCFDSESSYVLVYTVPLATTWALVAGVLGLGQRMGSAASLCPVRGRAAAACLEGSRNPMTPQCNVNQDMLCCNMPSCNCDPGSHVLPVSILRGARPNMPWGLTRRLLVQQQTCFATSLGIPQAKRYRLWGQQMT